MSEAYEILFEEVLRQQRIKKMKIYLDIDGVLLGRGWKPALHVTEFLKATTDKHDCYWLTTHCKDGDPMQAMTYLGQVLSAEAMEYCRKIKPITWSFKKTEGIDMKTDFLWFDDAPFDFEKNFLSERGKLESLIVVGLISNPDHLKELIELL